MSNQTIEKNKEKVRILETIKEYESSFLKLISKKLGILIRTHQLIDLQNVIVEYCHNLHCSPNEFLEILKQTPDHAPLLEQFIAKITVGETYFFRDKNQIRILQEQILPDIIKTKRDKNNLSLRIWSAGCASGEEIYTIAILLHELIPDKENWIFNLLGTDINTLSLQKAIKGEYNNWSLRSIPELYKNKYFSNENNKHILQGNIKKWVRFEYLNLNDDCYPSILNGTNAQDLILCRNVLIYFDNEHIANLMKKLNASLIPGGFLLLGASDPIRVEETSFVVNSKQPGLFLKPLTETIKVDAKLEKTKKAIVPQLIIKKIPVKTSPLTEKSSSKLIDQQQINELIKEAKWQEILELVNVNKDKLRSSAFLLYANATALANLGKLEDSLKIFQQSIAVDSTNKFVYFNYALALTELNLFDEAERSLRKTLFLDHEFVIAHYHLGLLLLRRKKEKEGLKCLQNALLISQGENPNKLVIESQSLNFGRLAEILICEIDLYKTKEEVHEG